MQCSPYCSGKGNERKLLRTKGHNNYSLNYRLQSMYREFLIKEVGAFAGERERYSTAQMMKIFVGGINLRQ